MAESKSNDELPAAGELSTHRPEAVLQFCERVAFTGTLTFSATDVRGVLPMLNGGPEIEEDPRIEWALEQFLGMTDGRYVLTQMLPPLEGATAEGLLSLRGKLDPVTIADLMRYCEGAGLSGEMNIRDEAGHHCTARYTRGELIALEVDEQGGADYTELFSWTRGSFDIRALSTFRETGAVVAPQAPARPSTGLLRTLEVALTEILSTSADRSQKLKPVGAALSMAPPSMLRGSSLPFGLEGKSDSRPAPSGLTGKYKARRSVAPAAHNPEATVKIQFVVRATDGVTPGGMVHSAARGGTEEIPMDVLTQKLPAMVNSAGGVASGASGAADLKASAIASAPPQTIQVAPKERSTVALPADLGGARPPPPPPSAQAGPDTVDDARSADSAGFRRALDADTAIERIRRGSSRPPQLESSSAPTRDTEPRERGKPNVALSIAFALVAAVTAVAALVMLARLMG